VVSAGAAVGVGAGKGDGLAEVCAGVGVVLVAGVGSGSSGERAFTIPTQQQTVRMARTMTTTMPMGRFTNANSRDTRLNCIGGGEPECDYLIIPGKPDYTSVDSRCSPLTDRSGL
jgi:hypothetical protein